MIGVIGALAGLVSPVGRIIGQIADAREDAARAENDRDKIAADERVEALEARKEILIAQTSSPGWWIAPTMRVLFALPFVLYFAKVVVWDKMLDFGATPDLSERQWYLAFCILSFYFASDMVARWRK